MSSRVIVCEERRVRLDRARISARIVIFELVVENSDISMWYENSVIP